MDWLKQNANWVFSGVGVALLTGLGYLLKRLFTREPQSQQQTVDGGSIGFQSGRDTKIERGNDLGQR